MSRYLFVATELAPHLRGGAGVVVARLRRAVLERGDEAPVVVVASSPVAIDEEGVTTVTAGMDDAAPTPFLARARAAAEAAGRLVTAHGADMVEFQDFEGLAFWALTRRGELGLGNTRLAVRVHGALDLLAETMAVVPDDWPPVRVMEAESLRMADVVIAPSPPIADLVVTRYGLEAERVVIGEPPLGPPAGTVDYRRPEPATVVALGRLAEVKGSEDMLRAAIELAGSHPDLRVRFVGDDGWSAAGNAPMRQWLQKMLPVSLRERITFSGHIPRQEWPRALADAWVAVIPSRFESFCLTAHEARAAGLPLVLADLPAYRPYFDESTGAVRYDGTAAGLAATLGDLLRHPERLDRLAAAPFPDYGDPLLPYGSPLPAPRHPQAQAGLGTEAVIRLAAVAVAPSPPADSAAARILRRLPEPVAKVLVRVTPRALKERLRRVASWPAEVERRRRQARHQRARAAAGSVSLAALPAPEISVVIPCFDQGDTLWDALASVYEQEFRSWEIVVVDDGSTDPATVAVIDDLDLPRVQVVRQANAGLPAARNAGMSVASGRYLVPLDADDELAPRFMATMHRALEERPEAAYAHCWAELFGDVNAVWATRPYNPYQMLLGNGVVGCVLLRRSAWEAVGGYDETMVDGNEDWELWVRLWAAGWDQVRLRDPLFRYRRLGSSMSTATEARFERGRAQIVARHPHLYRRTALWPLKQRWYPWVSVIVAGGTDPAELPLSGIEDAELVIVGAGGAGEGRWPTRAAADIWDAVAVSRGKFVADLRFGHGGPTDAVAKAAGALEDAPKALAAGDPEQPLLWRRWALVDPFSPHRGVRSVDVGPASGKLAQGAFAEAEYVDRLDIDLPVQRQSPEVEGPYPQWA